MADAVNPSVMSSAQLGKIQDLLAVGLRKLNLPGPFTQQVIETQTTELSDALAAVVCRFVEMIANRITSHVSVDRTRTPEAVLDATGRTQYTNAGVVKAMPGGGTTTDEVNLVFFKPRPEAYDKNGLISDDNVELEFEFQDLKPADSYALAKANEDDPAFADDHPNATHWKDKDGNWCYSAFNRWYGKRSVDVYRIDDGWRGRWWFAGVRK